MLSKDEKNDGKIRVKLRELERAQAQLDWSNVSAGQRWGALVLQHSTGQQGQVCGRHSAQTNCVQKYPHNVRCGGGFSYTDGTLPIIRPLVTLSHEVLSDMCYEVMA